MMRRPARPGFMMVALGVCTELIGLGVEALLHARDASLAAREGEFAFTNPGHALFVAGLVSSVVGVLIEVVPRRAVNPRLAARASALALAGAVMPGPNSAARLAHDHAQLHAQPDAAGAIALTHGNQVRISWAQLREIDRMLAQARSATAKYRALRLARADDYRQEGPSRRGEGAHFINRRLLDAGTFDLRHPRFLL